MKKVTIKKNSTYKLIILLVFVIAIFSCIKYIIAKYNNMATAENKIDIAFYALTAGEQTEELKINGLAPLSEKYEYNILVSNSKDGKVTDTAIEYTIDIKATTNLPLQYELYDYESYEEESKENQLTESEIIQDDDGAYYIHLTSSSKQFGLESENDEYVLTINFPEEYKNLIEYQNILELIEITVDSKQKS